MLAASTSLRPLGLINVLRRTKAGLAVDPVVIAAVEDVAAVLVFLLAIVVCAERPQPLVVMYGVQDNGRAQPRLGFRVGVQLVEDGDQPRHGALDLLPELAAGDQLDGAGVRGDGTHALAFIAMMSAAIEAIICGSISGSPLQTRTLT